MKIISQKVIFSIKKFNINEDVVSHDGNIQKTYWYVDKPNAVLVIVIHDNKIGLIKSERYLMGGVFSELLGGRIEANETSIEAAIREVKEECGLNIAENNIAFLLSTYTLPSITNEKVDVYTANITELNTVNLQQEELVKDFAFFEKDEILKLLENQEIMSCVDAYALTYYMLKENFKTNNSHHG